MNTRTHAFAEKHEPTVVDRFGVWLSKRQVERWVPTFQNKRVADFGCGFHAKLLLSLVPEVESALAVDVSLSPDVKGTPKVTAVEGTLPQALEGLGDASLDVVMCLSVLEHLWEPEVTLAHFRRLLAPGGVCLLNVPSWRGKAALEFSAFRMGMSPADEMNDHKMYYDPKDLWPQLVKAGFKPQNIQVFSHKFGLNTFAVCKA